jgi:hypothetical protein
MRLLDDYRAQQRSGKDPIFRKSNIAEMASNKDIECW